MVTKAKKSSVMNPLLLVAGALELIFSIPTLYTLMQISQLFNTLELSYSRSGIVYLGSVVIVAVLQIVIALFFSERVGNKHVKWLFILGIILSVLYIPALLQFIIMPIYSLTAAY